MRLAFQVSAVLGFLGVALGAFGAHALRDVLGTNAATWHTGTEYHLVHALAGCLAGTLGLHTGNRIFRNAAWLFSAGVVLFSFSLYAYALTQIRILGIITPLGGLAFLAGWALMIAGGKSFPASNS